ncbi:hypothetical protein FNV65_04015 [Streptomyces sp. S1A1-8]|uniref:hypothetical protein n=1 Tax=unclassified Streptomyces TaxID=2593676 RepID=UPI0011631BA2|nr:MULTISPECIES: hypothetical protein [unclassified Streptomyces]QDN95599.1 hypothetical protein FNV58_05450 [Streptomyces sp. RLB1-9]QDO17321.1 hypothetical protein FNV65_04015 [Streptomyces sp. S1A1-8]QDO27444.1 hypothetical protein FNV63_04005 [Streptomyces sp. S1A1-3]
MHSLKCKVATAALAAGALFGSLAVPGTAYAANKYVQLKVCSGSTETVKFYFVGENQYGDWGGSRFWEIAPKGCTVAEGYWWIAGQSVEFHHRKPSTGWRWEPRLISANDTSNGATYQLYIG